jgi:hypothetical protein
MLLDSSSGNFETPIEDATNTQAEISPLVLGKRALKLDGRSLGQIAVEANGGDASNGALICHNYTSAGLNSKGNLFPFHLAPTPYLDYPMSYLPLSSAGKDDTVLTLKTIPGFTKYLMERGILADTTVVHEVNPAVSDESSKVGFPFTDPMSLAFDSHKTFDPNNSNLPFVTTFPNDFSRKVAATFGMDGIQSSNAEATNNKALFRKGATEHGYIVPPGMELTDEDSLEKAVELLQDASKVWVKLAHGAGGDNVIAIDGPISIESLKKARDRLFLSAVAAFTHSDFGEGALNEYWPEDSFAPLASTITVEQDIGDLGEVLLNLSSSFVTNIDGRYETRGWYQQNIGEDGAFLGSSPVELSPELLDLLEVTTAQVSAYCAANKLYGLAGKDLLVVKTPEGEIMPVLIELNGRPSSSENTHQVADKLGAPYWINLNMNAPMPVTSMDDLLNAMTMEDGTCLATTTVESGTAVPLAFQTLMLDDEAVVESNDVRFVIASSSSYDDCVRVLEQLKSLGFTIDE